MIQLQTHQRCQGNVKERQVLTLSPPATPAKVLMVQGEEPDVIRKVREEETQFGEVDKTAEIEGMTIARLDTEGGEETAPKQYRWVR